MSLSHLIGTQAFLPALLTHIRNSATAPAVPLDHVILQSILLCLIAGEKHLILRTPEEDVPLAAQLAAWTLSCIFDRPTRRLKIRPTAFSRASRSAPGAPSGASHHDGTTAFLRSLFIQPGSNSADEEYSSSENAKHFGAGNSGVAAHSRPPSRAGAGSKAKRPHSEHHAHGGAQDFSSESFGTIYPVDAANTQSSTAPTIVRPRPIYPRSRDVPHAYTDPLPLYGHGHADHGYPHRRHRSGGSHTHAPPEPPHGLVLSNLEDASDAVQRVLARVFSEKRIVLPAQGQGTNTWQLPEGFLAIAVCPWSATERPALHKSLLDKFSMSANVFVPSSVRRDLHLLPFSIPALRMLGGMGGDRVFPHSTPNSPARPFAVALPVTQTPPPALPSSLPPHQQHAHAYPPPSSHASAHTHPHLAAHQRSATYAAPTAHAHSARPPAPLFPVPPVTPALLAALRDAHAHTRIAPTLQLYLSDTLSAARAHSRLDALLLSARAHQDAEALVRAVRVVGTDLTGAELLRPSQGTVSGYEQHEAQGEEGAEVEPDEEEEDYHSALDVWVAEGSAAHGPGSEHERAPLMSSPKKSTGGTSTTNASPKERSTTRPPEERGGRDQDEEEEEWRGQWLDAAEVDVARVVPRVVSHRVRLRSGPQDEVLASALFGATFAPTAGSKGTQTVDGQGQELDSVKAVLVQILADV